MRILALISVLALSGCIESTQVMSYEQLVKYPVQCAKADEQLKELRQVQAIKNFNPDPDSLNEDDRAYNSRLKATIWWYAYSCDKS
jgi:Tfp pilus assembly protein PilP